MPDLQGFGDGATGVTLECKQNSAGQAESKSGRHRGDIILNKG